MSFAAVVREHADAAAAGAEDATAHRGCTSTQTVPAMIPVPPTPRTMTLGKLYLAEEGGTLFQSASGSGLTFARA